MNPDMYSLYIGILKKGWTVKKYRKHGEIVVLMLNCPDYWSFKRSYLLGTSKDINNFKQYLHDLSPYRDLDILGIW